MDTTFDTKAPDNHPVSITTVNTDILKKQNRRQKHTIVTYRYPIFRAKHNRVIPALISNIVSSPFTRLCYPPLNITTVSGSATLPTPPHSSHSITFCFGARRSLSIPTPLRKVSHFCQLLQLLLIKIKYPKNVVESRNSQSAWVRLLSKPDATSPSMKPNTKQALTCIQFEYIFRRITRQEQSCITHTVSPT